MVYDLNGTALSAGGSSSGMLNVLDYGFKADGTTDNLTAFHALIAAHPAETLFFPKGVYAFSGKLVFDQCYMELDNAELKCTAATKVDRFIEIRGKMTPPETPQQDMFIRGNGKVNANFKADDCIALARQKCTLIDHISIQNFQRYGICGKFEDASMGKEDGQTEVNLSYELMVRNCLIESSLDYPNAVGIYDTGDSMYSDTIILNVKTALSCNGSSVFHNIHAWCFDFNYSDNDTKKALLENTVFARIRGNATRFSDCYIDCYQKGFQFDSGQYLIYITNLKWYIAPNAWSTGLTAYVFPANPAGQAMYKVFNADINGSGVTKFSDVDLSSQTNCRWYGIVHNLSDAPSTLQ